MKNIHVFHGADSKSGTTMISQSVAEFLAKNMKADRVMLVSLHGRPGTEYTEKVGESIDNLKIHLANEMLDLDALLENSRRKDGLHQIGGVAELEGRKVYTPQMCSYLLKSISPIFKLVIVDSGNDLDNPLSLGALTGSKNLYCVFSQQETALSRFEMMKPYYDKLEIRFSTFILNKFLSGDPISVPYVRKRLSLEGEIFKVEKSSQDRVAEREKKTLLNLSDSRFISNIQELSNKVLANADLPFILKERKKTWMPFI